VNPQEKQADDGQLTDQLSISVLLRIAGSTRGAEAHGKSRGYDEPSVEQYDTHRFSLYSCINLTLMTSRQIISAFWAVTKSKTCRNA
jgi:hypothetical protein